ncbi:MAG TPA: RagB/SusD family nutrient uptake outer membrane protein [Cyclobacteriaceae bacterium]
MKKVKRYILICGALVLSACSDSFLNVQPPSKLAEENFYKTPAQAYTALVGCYDGLQILWSGGGVPFFTEVLSDNAFGGGGNADGFGLRMLDEFDKTKSPTDVNMFSDNWSNAYKAIYRCNVLLENLDKVDWGTQTDLKTKYEAEARFLRAFFYFETVRFWGNIPLLTEPSIANIPQANPDDVYKVIAEDLQFAIDNIPAQTYQAQPASTHGRVTKWAAESLLARVYLYYTGYYSKTDLVGVVTKAQALAYVEDVIANSGHDLVSDFAKLWPAASGNSYAGEDNIETVFAIKYTYTSDYSGNTDGNQWMVMFGIRGYSFTPYGNGWGGGTVNPKLYNLYDDADTRKVATITSLDEDTIVHNSSFDLVKIKADQREYTGYYNKKYSPMSDGSGQSLAVKLGGVNFMIGQYEDYVSIRYADVLLMAAELGSPNAQTYFDKVRARAYKAAFSSIPVSQNSIMVERQLEFAGEGIRYWDLLRQGISVASAAIAESTTLLDGGVSTTKTITASNIEATKGLMQIPTTQVTLSGGTLVQNTGW